MRCSKWSGLLFARMVPNSFSHPTIALLKETDNWAKNFKGPVALVWGLKDPILGRSLYRVSEKVDKVLSFCVDERGV